MQLGQKREREREREEYRVIDYFTNRKLIK